MYAQAQVKARRRPDSGEVRNPGISYVAGAASGGTFAMPSLGHGRQGVGRINWLSQPAGKCAHKTARGGGGPDSLRGPRKKKGPQKSRRGAVFVDPRPLPYRLAQNLRRQTGDALSA